MSTLREYLKKVYDEDANIEVSKSKDDVGTGMQGTYKNRTISKMSRDDVKKMIDAVPGLKAAVEKAGGFEVLLGKKMPPYDISITGDKVSINPDAKDGGAVVPNAKLSDADLQIIDKLLAEKAK